MPPTIEETRAFEKDGSPLAFQKVVDRLLDSPHYGERWGRYWLDVARYADDKALAFANPWPHAWRYRDWVVKALNDDLPYDRFVRLQLAGDLLPEPKTDYALRLAGLGFQGLGAVYHKGSVAEQVKADELATVTLAEADRLLGEADGQIESDRYERVNASSIAEAAAERYRHAIRIAQQVRALENGGEQTVETLIRDHERQLGRIAALLGIEASFSAGVEPVIDEIVAGSTEQLDSDLAALSLFGMLNWVYMWYDPSRHSDLKHLALQLSSIFIEGIRPRDETDRGYA